MYVLKLNTISNTLTFIVVFTLAYLKNVEGPITVRIFHAAWSKDQDLPDVKAFLELFDCVEGWKKQTPKGKTLVHCL